MSLLDTALSYLKGGMSVIPVAKDKKPLITWKPFQDRLPSEGEVKTWWTLFPEAQIGFVTGKISKLIVVDIEAGGDYSWLPQETTIVKTGGGGRHYYYRFCEGVNNSVRIKNLVDIRGEAGYVIAPPSETTKGKYEWIIKQSLLPFPKHLFEKEQKVYQSTPSEYVGYGEGQRNDQMAKYIGHLLAKIHPSEWNTLAWRETQQANLKNTPPLSETELLTIFKSISGKEQSSGTNRWYKNDIKNLVFAKKENYKLRYTWGTPNLDNKFAIIKRVNFIIIGAKRSEGKTTFTFDMAVKNAMLGHKVLYISLEMDDKEIKEDFARKYSGITIPEERDYAIPEYKKNAFERKLKEINEVENLIFEGVRRGNGTLWEDIIGIIGKYPDIDLVFIDNLDLIESNNVENNNDKQKRIVKSIMNFTAENKIPIVLIHHYRKQGAGKDYGMDELSGSGKVPDSADIVVKISRNQEPEAVYPEKFKSRLILQKARGYQLTLADIYFIKGTFVDTPPEFEMTDYEKSLYDTNVPTMDLAELIYK